MQWTNNNDIVDVAGMRERPIADELYARQSHVARTLGTLTDREDETEALVAREQRKEFEIDDALFAAKCQREENEKARSLRNQSMAHQDCRVLIGFLLMSVLVFLVQRYAGK